MWSSPWLKDWSPLMFCIQDPSQRIFPQLVFCHIIMAYLGRESTITLPTTEYAAGVWGVSREYWIICRGPGFLAVVWLGSSPTPFPPPLVCRLNRLDTGSLRKRKKFAHGRGERGWARSQIIQHWESLALYKSFNTFWVSGRRRWGLQH